MKRFLSVILLLALVPVACATWFTNSVSVDSFVRVLAPTANYGGSGALSVSGTNAVNGSGVTNGASDTFIRFNTAAMVTNFNFLLGTNNWVINGAKLQIMEVGAPGNGLFNRGVGSFEIRWIANDNWIEGSGTPNAPTNNGIVYTNEATLLNPVTDKFLGIFTNAGLDGTLSFPLALPVEFTSDLSAGSEVGLFLTAIDSGIGFTFDSRSFGIAWARPFLAISAVPRPGLSSITVSGTDVALIATNGAAGGTYYVFSSTNATLPLGHWATVATNMLDTNGDFSITLTNAAAINSPPVQFFILKTQ